MISKKIALFMPSFQPGGAEKNIIYIANYFTKKKYIVDLLVLNDFGILKIYLNRNVNIINFNVSRSIFSIFKLICYLNNNDPIVLISTLRHLNILSIYSKRFSKSNTKVIIRESNVFYPSNNYICNIKNNLLSFIARYSYNNSFKIIAVSKSVKKSLIQELNISEKLIDVIYNSINIDEIISKSKEINDHLFLKESNVPTILSVGSLTNQKNYSNLLKAFSLVLKRKRCNLIIIGEGNEKNSLIKLSNKLNIINNVSFVGAVDNPYSFMKLSQLFVLSSDWEGLPNVLIEALACDMKVVSTDSKGGSCEVLENGKWGVLVEVNNYEKLSSVILNVLDQKSYFNAKKRVDFFSSNKQLQLYENYII